MISFRRARPRILSTGTKTANSWTVGTNDCAKLVCATAMGFYEKLGHEPDQLVYEGHLLGIKTLCRRSFSVQRDGKVSTQLE